MKVSRHVMIISGGSCDQEFAKQFLAKNSIDTVIAVDGGLKIADEIGRIPDYIVGDFDTIESDIIQKYTSMADSKCTHAPKILEFCPEKDDTDTEIAIRLCIQLGAKKVTIVGATGTRLDHTFANIHLLKMLLEAGIEAAIYDQNNKIYLINHKISLTKQNLYGNYFSMLPLTEKVTEITLKGFKYPLNRKDISFGTSLCISNEVVEDTATVELGQGILIIFESKD